MKYMSRGLTLLAAAIVSAVPANLQAASGPGNVVIVANRNSALSKSIAEYYARMRHVPRTHICYLNTSTQEHVSRHQYETEIEAPLARFLKSLILVETTFYVVTTSEVPLIVDGGGSGMESEVSSVDSELTLLYSVLHGKPHQIKGPLQNPYYGALVSFSHPRFPIYLVTRLSAWDFNDVKAMIDRSLVAGNHGNFVIDQTNDSDKEGNNWLRDAMILLPTNRVVYDATPKIVTGERNVIGYASWGSNDTSRTQRHLNFQWLPGAIAIEYVSTNARTMARPPDSWIPSLDWNKPAKFFANSPQSLATDYIHDGATGASGHVTEPFLQFCPRPQMVLPAYYQGEPLAEAFYRGIPAVSWQNIVLGDPLCSLGRP
jgi:uncharacterized protein (TIGR03790 family)